MTLLTSFQGVCGLILFELERVTKRKGKGKSSVATGHVSRRFYVSLIILIVFERYNLPAATGATSKDKSKARDDKSEACDVLNNGMTYWNDTFAEQQACRTACAIEESER